MKKALLTITLVLGLAFAGLAQRFAFVDTQYILDNMPEYTSAQEELDRISEGYQGEILDRYDMIANMKEAFEAEKILLSDEMKQQRLDEIERRESEAKALQKKRFGVNGDLFGKREELISPIQDRVYTAIKEVAGTSYVAIFDISGNSNLLFANEKYDKSDNVLRKLGIRPGSNNSGGSSGGSDKNSNDVKPSEGSKDSGGSMQPRTPGRGGSTTPSEKK